MSNTDIKSCVEKAVVDKDITDISDGFLNSTSSTLVFYNLNPDQKSLEAFLQRVSKSSYGFLVVNGKMAEEVPGSIAVSAEDFNDLQDIYCQRFYPIDSSKKFIGITGTNGKTTTVHLCVQICHQMGIKAISIGTIGVKNADEIIAPTSTLTTPSFIDTRKILFQFKDQYEYCFLEVSSHAAVQKRIRGIPFSVSAFMSFTRDHLDYHENEENYFNAKKLFLDNYLIGDAPIFVPNSQTDLQERLKEIYSITIPRTLEERGISSLPAFFRTTFNKGNLEIALGICEYLTSKEISPDLDRFKYPEGRFFIYEVDGRIFAIDSAHTPDAFSNIIKATKEAFPDKSLWVLFGCGGSRDRKKRPIMGGIVNGDADRIFLTSDNVRDEDPLQIIEDIKPSLDLNKTVVEPDREKAVAKAFEEMKDDCILLMLGKGHEDYQIVKGELVSYSEIGAIEKARKGSKK